jgi:hypothetical protein
MKFQESFCMFQVLRGHMSFQDFKVCFFFWLLKHPPNVQATILWALIYFIKGVTYVDYFRCMYWILTGIILSD